MNSNGDWYDPNLGKQYYDGEEMTEREIAESPFKDGLFYPEEPETEEERVQRLIDEANQKENLEFKPDNGRDNSTEGKTS